MKVNILYDKYNTKIEKATLLFGDTPEENRQIDIEIIKEDGDEENNESTVNKVRFTNIDLDTEIVNEMTKDDLRTFLNLLRNILGQI